MISLPIIFREFRVAARRKRTFVLRFVFGALLAGMVLMFIVGYAASPGSQAMGRYLLNTFAWEIFVLVFVAAPALTCGCISDERKEGTLDLLFLTDINAADIVLGKFIGKGFDAMMLFLAAMPFLFVPMLLGGVDWDLILGMVFTILSLLLLGLALGVFSSTVARTTAAAFVLAYFGLIAYNVALVVLPSLNSLHLSLGRGVVLTIPDRLRLASPVNGLLGGGVHRTKDALVTLLICGTMSAALLLCAIWRLPRSTADSSNRGPSWLLPARRWFSKFQKVRRVDRSRLDRNPILWLNLNHSRARWLVQAVVAFGLFALFTAFDSAGMMLAFGWLLWLCTKLLIVVYVARSFATEKEDGSLELLMTTPLVNRKIVHGKLLSVLWRYGILAAAACGLMVLGAVQLNASIFALYPIYLVGSELLAVVCLCMLISVWAKTVTQAITLSIVLAVFVSTVLKFALVLCICSFLAEPIIAIVAYSILVGNLRQYAAR